MALGAVYIRPQPLLLPATDEVTPADVILAFAESILKDPEAAVPAFIIMGEEATNALRDFLAGLEEKMRLADGKLRNVFQPLIDPVQTFVNGFGNDALSTIPAVLEGLAKLLDEFTSDRIVGIFRNLLNIFQNDLGVSQTTIKNLVDDIFSRMIERLQSRVTSGDTSKEAVALYDFGSGLDDIRLLLEREVQLPAIDFEAVLGFIGKFWQDFGIDRIVLLIRQILDRGNQILDPVTKILHAVAEINVSVSVRPTNRFMASNGSPAAPSTGDPSSSTAWYASWIAGQEVRFDAVNLGPTPGVGPTPPPDAPTLFNNDFLRGITYATFKKETMEAAAYHTAWIFPLFEALFLHGFSIEQGDLLNNLNAIIFDLVEFGLIIHEESPGGFKRRPMPWFVKGYIWPASSFLFRALETIPRFFTDALTVSLIGADIAEDLLYRRWIWLARELILSIMTLANHDQQALDAIRNSTTDSTQRVLVEKYKNLMFFDGICLTAGEIGMLLLPLIFSFSNRGNYKLVSELPFAFLPGFFIPFGFNTLGYLLVRLLTKQAVFEGDAIGRFFRAILYERMFRNYSASGNFLEATGNVTTSVLAVIVGVVMYPLNYLVYLHWFTDSHTNGGTLAIDTQPQSAPQNLAGYPATAQSPYLLPFAGSQQMCIQGNMGIFSHNPTSGSGQTYAFDFTLNQGVEVLCSRAGIVVDIDDTIPTGQTGANAPWNYVEIMHLIVIPPGATPPPGVVPLIPTAPPAGVGTFTDGTTPLPPGIAFPPYWNPVTGASVIGFNPPLHPSGAILPAGWTPPAAAPYYAGFPGFPAGTRFAFLIPSQDMVGFGANPSAAPPVPGTVLLNGLVPGTVLPNGLAGGLLPIAVTLMVYGHGLNSFMTQNVPAAGGANKPIYRAGTANRNRVLGQFMKQGQVIMLADNTGVSFLNHVHVHVMAQFNVPGAPGSGGAAQWSIPFVYSDVGHSVANGFYKAIAYGSGTARIFTTYNSGNTRVPPE